MIRGIANFDFQMFELMKQENITITEACKILRSFGYTHMEVDFDNLSDEIRTAYRESGLAISNIFDFIPFDEPENVICAKLDAMILKAAEVGAPFIMPLPQNEPEDLSTVWRILQSRADLLKANHVTMILEDFGSEKLTYYNIAGVKAYMDNVPAMKCCFDTGNFAPAGESIAAAWAQLGKDTVHFHLKDHIFSPDGKYLPTPVGTGKLGLPDFVRARLKEGFDGILALEQAPMACQREASRISIKNVKSIL